MCGIDRARRDCENEHSLFVLRLCFGKCHVRDTEGRNAPNGATGQSEGGIGLSAPERFGVPRDFRPHWEGTGGNFHIVAYPSVSAGVGVRDR